MLQSRSYSTKLECIIIIFILFPSSLHIVTLSLSIHTRWPNTIKGEKYIKDQKIYNLTFNIKERTGNYENYLDLSLSLLNNSTNRFDYKYKKGLCFVP